jgi:hypothetical protein
LRLNVHANSDANSYSHPNSDCNDADADTYAGGRRRAAGRAGFPRFNFLFAFRQEFK